MPYATEPCGRCQQLGRAEACRVVPGRKRGRPSNASKTFSENSSKQRRPVTSAPAPSAGAPLPHNVAAGGKGDGADDYQLFMLKTLVTMLADDMRNVKRQNRELSAEVSELREFRKQSQQRIRQLELLQEQNANHINTLIAHITSTSTSSSPSTSSPPSPLTTTSTSTSTSSSSSSSSSSLPVQSALSSSSHRQIKAVPLSFPPPPTLYGSDRHDMVPPFPRATSVFQELPFLRDYSGARLIIADVSQAFFVLRSVERTDHPVILYCSPSAGALLGYWPEELVNRPVTDIGCPDIDTIVLLMAEIQRRPPPGRVGPPFSTSIVWRRKSGEGCRLQCQHQNLWPGPPELPQTKWHLVRLDRVVESGLPSPVPVDLASFYAWDPSLLRAKLAHRPASSLLPAASAPPEPPLCAEAQQATQGDIADGGFDRGEQQLPQHDPWGENSGLLSAVGHEEEKGPDDGTLSDLDELVADMLRSPPDSSGHLFSSLADDFGLP